MHFIIKYSQWPQEIDPFLPKSTLKSIKVEQFALDQTITIEIFANLISKSINFSVHYVYIYLTLFIVVAKSCTSLVNFPCLPFKNITFHPDSFDTYLSEKHMTSIHIVHSTWNVSISYVSSQPIPKFSASSPHLGNAL